MIIANTSVRLFTLFLLSACLFAQDQRCPAEGSTANEAIVFLRNAKNDSSVPDACIAAAIRSLQYEHSDQVVNILTMFLDYRRPTASLEVATGSTSEMYPAVSSLFAIGKQSLPALIKVVIANSSTKVAQDNAVRTIMLIHRDNPSAGIRFLLKEAGQSQDAGERSLLRQAANSGLRWCHGKHRAECDSALSSQ